MVDETTDRVGATPSPEMGIEDTKLKTDSDNITSPKVDAAASAEKECGTIPGKDGETSTPVNKTDCTRIDTKRNRTDSQLPDLRDAQEGDDESRLINFSLMAANVTLIHEILEQQGRETRGYNFCVSLSLLSLSIVLQLLYVFGSLFRCTRPCANSDEDCEKGDKRQYDGKRKNSYVLALLTMIIVVVNILVGGFTPSPEDHMHPRMHLMLNSTLASQ